MYTPNPNSKLIKLDNIPQCDKGAPLPVVIGTELNLQLGYYIEKHDPNWHGQYITIVHPDKYMGDFAFITFQGVTNYFSGQPNDEAIQGHPLYINNLQPYSAYEVTESPWTTQMEKMNSVHPRHNPERFKKLKHYIFTFHDTTFECMATSYTVEIHYGTANQMAVIMAERIPKLQEPNKPQPKLIDKVRDFFGI